MKDKDGVYKCNVCGLETGLRSKAWNHASRCGMKKNKKPRKKLLVDCHTCNKSFKSRKALVQHFRVQHQQSRFICALCSKPATFKYRHSFKRHCSLKHSRSGIVPGFKCDWCDYKATQKVNLRRHKLRKHKSFIMVSSLVNIFVDQAVSSSHLNGLCPYERIRLENIRENRALLEELFPKPKVPKAKGS